jgi:hypothetical protein
MFKPNIDQKISSFVETKGLHDNMNKIPSMDEKRNNICANLSVFLFLFSAIAPEMN